MTLDDAMIPLCCTGCGAQVDIPERNLKHNFSVAFDGGIVYYGGNPDLEEVKCTHCGRKWLAKSPITRVHENGGEAAKAKVVEAIAMSLNLTVTINGDNNTVTNVSAGPGGVAVGGNVKGSIVVGPIRNATGVVIGNGASVKMNFD